VSDAAIRVENITKQFTFHSDRRDSLKERFIRGRSRSTTHFKALDDVSFDIPRGTTFGLIGHNGSGKSTMLKILAGVYRPTSGRLLVDGRVSALLELGAGFHGELTGRENIYLNGAILGMGKRQIDASIDEIIEFADIGDFIDTPVKVYSSGMYVRLGFAIAVNLDPEILIVDEIIAVGDEEYQRKCFDHLHRLRRQGATIALVTHSMGLATDLCDKAVWLDHGRARLVGDVREVVTEYMNAVNEKEAAARAAEEGKYDIKVGSAIARKGSGDVRMTRVEFLGEDGRVGVITAGKRCTVRVHFRAHEAVRHVELGLAFHHESGLILAGPHSREGGVLYDIEPGDGFADFVLDPLPFLAGSYLLTTAFVDKGHAYDYADREVTFAVRSSGVDGNGLMTISGRWSPAVGVPVP